MNNLFPLDGEASEESLELKEKLHKELTNTMELRNIKMPVGWSDRESFEIGAILALTTLLSRTGFCQIEF